MHVEKYADFEAQKTKKQSLQKNNVKKEGPRFFIILALFANFTWLLHKIMQKLFSLFNNCLTWEVHLHPQ